MACRQHLPVGFKTPIQILGYLALLSIGTCHFLDAEFQEIWSDKILGSKNQMKKTGYILDSCARATQVLKTEMPTLKTPCIFFSCVWVVCEESSVYIYHVQIKDAAGHIPPLLFINMANVRAVVVIKWKLINWELYSFNGSMDCHHNDQLWFLH